MTDAIDHEARQQSAIALERIEAHERHCGERWSEARDQLDTLNKRWWWLLSAPIIAAAPILAAILLK